MTATGPDFVALQVRDLERAARFYDTHVGLARAAACPPGAVVFTTPIAFAVREPLPGPRSATAMPSSPMRRRSCPGCARARSTPPTRPQRGPCCPSASASPRRHRCAETSSPDTARTAPSPPPRHCAASSSTSPDARANTARGRRGRARRCPRRPGPARRRSRRRRRARAAGPRAGPVHRRAGRPARGERPRRAPPPGETPQRRGHRTLRPRRHPRRGLDGLASLPHVGRGPPPRPARSTHPRDRRRPPRGMTARSAPQEPTTRRLRIVTRAVATSVSRPSATEWTSAAATVVAEPAWTTRPRATTLSPRAGATILIV